MKLAAILLSISVFFGCNNDPEAEVRGTGTAGAPLTEATDAAPSDSLELTTSSQTSPQVPAPRSMHVAKSLVDQCVHNFSKSGYKAKNLCQDAAQGCKRIMAVGGINSRRLNFQCMSALGRFNGHAILMIEVVDGNNLKWMCPVEPQLPSSSSNSSSSKTTNYSNIDDSLCIRTDDMTIPSESLDALNKNLCRVYGYGLPAGIELLSEGQNPQSTLDSPKFCAELYGDNLDECFKCCSGIGRASSSNSFKQFSNDCNYHCNTAQLNPYEQICNNNKRGYDVRVSVSGRGRVDVRAPVGSNIFRQGAAVDLVRDIPAGSTVSFYASPDPGSRFLGWSGACSGVSFECKLEVRGSIRVEAKFSEQSLVNVTLNVNGQGTVREVNGAEVDLKKNPLKLPVSTEVSLEAVPAKGSKFIGWSGLCSGTNPLCKFKVPANNASLTANFQATSDAPAAPSEPPAPEAPKSVLTLTKPTAATITVTIDPAGSKAVSYCVAGLSSCGYTVIIGTEISLLANPTSTLTFVGWNGGACSTVNSCFVTMDKSKSVAAIYSNTPTPSSNPNPVPSTQTVNLQVSTKGGVADGTIIGEINGKATSINCSGVCNSSVGKGVTVTLMANPKNSTFAGWNICPGTVNANKCTVTMDISKTVVANFSSGTSNPTPTQPAPSKPVPVAPAPSTTATLSVTKEGLGAVTSVHPTTSAISCGSLCSGSFNIGTYATLMATPSLGYNFVRWEGSDAVKGMETVPHLTVKFPNNMAKVVKAVFVQNKSSKAGYLNVYKNGEGSGVVLTKSDDSIYCGGSCSGSYGAASVVVLQAWVPDNFSTFKGWSGCTVVTNDNECHVSIPGGSTTNVYATFGNNF